MKVSGSLLGSLGLLLGCAAPHPEMLTSMPPEGALRPNQVVLVDDGRCPPGQVTQVIGGSNRYYQTDTVRPGTARQAVCIPRP